MCKHSNFQANSVLATLLCIICSTAVQAELPDPVSIWRFEEGSGQSAADTGVGGFHGTLVGNVAFVQDEERGSVLEFGTNESFVDTHAWITDVGDADFSMAAWIQTSRDGIAIVGKSNGDRDWSFHEKQFYLSAGTEQGAPVAGGVHFYGNQAGEIWGANEVDTGAWHHVCVTWDNDTDEQHIYVDGELDDLGPVWPYYGGRGDNADDTIRIGFDCSGDATSDFNGRMDDVAIFNVTLTPEQVLELMHLPLPANASNPRPYDGTMDALPQEVVLTWNPGPSVNAHNVYFGTTFDDVNDAGVGNPLDVLAGEAQTHNTYDPGLLDHGLTYFWRVDEVMGAPDFAVIKGEVWSFATEAFALPIKNVKVTASSSDTGSDPNKTVDGSGLDEMNQHGTSADDMWLSVTETPAWIQYEFDKAYKLHEMWVWNANTSLEFLFGLSVKDVVIETSVDGVDWTVVEGATQFAQGPGSDTYEHDTTVDLGNLLVKYVKININSGWGPFGQYSLSEVRFTHIPTFARNPKVTAKNAVEVVLDWRAGREADQHTVYVSTDENAVADGTASSEISPTNNLDLASFGLLLGQTYYWRVDEVNEAEVPSTWAGDVWSFNTPAALVVDNFDSYGNKSPNRPFQTWLDGFGYSADEFFSVGYGGNGTGAGVGHDIWSLSSSHFDGAIMEETIAIQGSSQSMPFYYSSGGATPQTDRIWLAPQDWTKGGAQTLVLYFYGAPENTGQLYVQVNNGTKVTYDGSADAMTTADWTQWNIDLASLGVNLQSVTQLSIGAQGGSGMVLIDDILLYP
ncbi:MAG: discoidin domain-containing protein [Phycisphaeraceae bacterium]|nr:discoidin domain-containing protein [Phycisphaeraceae bacterium]